MPRGIPPTEPSGQNNQPAAAATTWKISNLASHLPGIPFPGAAAGNTGTMEQRPIQEFDLEVFADPASVKEVVKGLLHVIFFHRYFPTISPQTWPVLSLTLPYVDEAELETLIEQRALALEQQLNSERAGGGGSATTTAATAAAPAAPSSSSSPLLAAASAATGALFSSSPKKGAGVIGGSGAGNNSNNNAGGRGQITVKFFERKRRKGAWIMRGDEEVCWETWFVKVTVAEPKTENERIKLRQAMESTLLGTVRKVMRLANEKDHIPPITATGQNPFPYQIIVNPKQQPSDGWAARAIGGLY